MKSKNATHYLAALKRAREYAQTFHEDYVVTHRGLYPVTHIAVEGRGFDWAVLDSWCTGPSNYAGHDDAAADIAATLIKPNIELTPTPVKDWFPVYEASIKRALREIAQVN